jgi:hypothetical protein
MMGTENNQPILQAPQLLRQVFGAASIWWGLQYKVLFCCSQKGGLWHQRDGSSHASFILEGQRVNQ